MLKIWHSYFGVNIILKFEFLTKRQKRKTCQFKCLKIYSKIIASGCWGKEAQIRDEALLFSLTTSLIRLLHKNLIQIPIHSP